MGKPVRIVDLAEDVIRFYGLTPNVDVPIIFSGIRPGEKLFEELFTEEEGAEAASHERLLIAHLEQPTDEWLSMLTRLTEVAAKGADKEVVDLLRTLVPPFQERE
jgi:FlaA1/EpsC-like NDP-sugar epimerase